MGNIINLFKEEQTMPTIFDIANFFLSKSSMTHKKLQKLCCGNLFLHGRGGNR